MKPSELKAAYQAKDPAGHFFDRGTMRFFGDSMANFGVRSTVIRSEYDAAGNYCRDGVVRQVWELYRKRPVMHGLRGSHYFDKVTMATCYPIKEEVTL